jgi:hypothetical protein
MAKAWGNAGPPGAVLHAREAVPLDDSYVARVLETIERGEDEQGCLRGLISVSRTMDAERCCPADKLAVTPLES